MSTHNGYGDKKESKCYECKNARCPGETNRGLEAAKGDGQDYSSNTASTYCDSCSKCAFFIEICSHDSHTWNEETTATDTNTKALGKQDLPVVFADASHHETKDGQEATQP